MTESPDLGSVLVQLLPIALAGTFSWLPVTGILVLLLSSDGRPKAPAFLLGRVVGMGLMTVAFVAGARALPPFPALEGPFVAWTEIGVGVALVVVGVVAWVRRGGSHRGRMGSWLERLGDASTVAVLGASLLVDLQPKGILLALSAGVVLRTGRLPALEAVVAVALYLALASSSVLVPVVASVLAPTRTRRVMQAAQRWLDRHGSVVTAVVVAAVGIVLLVDGFRRF